MTQAEFNSVFLEAINKWRELAPKRTGHLAFNAIKGRWINDTHFKIYVDRNIIINEPNPEGVIAGYYYPSVINRNSRYKTYKWVERTALEIARYIAYRLKGEIR